MRHDKEKYQGIQYLPGTEPEDHAIKDDEPVFLLRASDEMATNILANASVMYNEAGSFETSKSALRTIEAFIEWQKKNVTRMPK